MDQTVIRKDTTTVSKTITSDTQIYQPIVKSSYLRPKFGLNNIKSKETLLQKRSFVRPRIQSTTQLETDDKQQSDKTVESKTVEVTGSTVDALQRRYGKYGNFVAKLARKGLIAPRRPKSNIQPPVNAKTDKTNVGALSAKPKYNKIQLQLLKRGIPRATVRKLDTKTIETYQEYLALKSEMLVADETRQMVLNEQLSKMELANSQLLQTLGGAEFDDIKDGIFKGYQDVLSEMSNNVGKPIGQDVFDAYVRRVSGLNRQIDGLVDKVKNQQTNSAQWESGLSMIDKRLAFLFNALVSEQDPGKRAEMQLEMNELDTKFKPMFKQMIASAQQDVAKWAGEIESIKTLQTQFNKSLSAAYNGERIVASKLMQTVNTLSDMFGQMSTVGSIIINQQMMGLWFNESAVDFMSAWASYKFLNDPNNLDNEQVRNYMIAKRASLPEVKAKISGFAAKMTVAGMDFYNLEKKYQSLTDGFHSATKRIDSLRNEIAEIQSSIVTIGNLSEQTRVKIGSATLTKAQLEVKLAQLSGQLYMLETDMGISARKQNLFANDVSTLDNLKAKVDALELQAAKITGFFQQNESIMPTLRVINSMMKIAREFKDTSEQVNKQAAEENQNRLQENASKLKEKQAEAKKLQDDTDNLARQNAKLAAERVAAEAKLAEKRARLQELETTQKDAEKNLNQLRAEIELQGIEVEKTVEKQTELEAKIGQNKTELDRLSLDVQDRQNKVEALTGEAKQLEDNIAALKLAQGMENTNLKNITDQIGEQAKKLDKMTQDNQKLQNERLELEARYREKEEQEIAKLQERLRTEQANIIQNAVDAKQAELQSKIDELQTKLENSVSKDEMQQEMQKLKDAQPALLKAAEQKARDDLAMVHAQQLEAARGVIKAELEAEITERITAELTIQNKSVEDALAKKEREFERMKKDFEVNVRSQATEAEKQRLTKEFEAITTKYEQDKNALNNKITDLDEKVRELNAIKAENETLKANAEFLGQQLTNALAFIGQQASSIAVLERDLSTKRQELVAATTKLTESKEEEERLKGRVTALESALNEAKKTINEQQQKLTSAAEALAKQKGEYDELQKQKTAVDNQLKNANETISTYQKEIQEKTAELNKVTTEATAKQNELDKARKTNNDLESQVKKKNDELNGLNADKVRIEKRLKEIRDQLGASETEGDENFIKRLREREARQLKSLKEKDEQITASKNEAEQLKQNLADAQKKSSELTGELEKANEKIETLNDTIRSKQNEITSLQGKVTELEEKNTSLKSANEQLSIQVGNLTNQNNILNSEKEALEKDVERLSDDIKKKDERLAEQADELKKKNDKINALQSEVKNLKSENAQLLQENAALRSQLQEEQQNRKSLAQILGSNHSEAWKDIQKSVKELKMSNESQSTMLQALAPLLLSKTGNKFTAEDVRLKVSELADLVNAYKQDDTEDVFTVINRVFAMTSAQKEQLTSQQSTIEAQSEEIKSLKEKDQAAAQRIEELQAQLADVTQAKEKANTDLNALREEYDDLQEDFDRVNRRKLELERQHDKIYEQTMIALDEAITLGTSLRKEMADHLEDVEFWANADNVEEYKAIAKKIKTFQLPYMDRYLSEWQKMKTTYQKKKDDKGVLVIPKEFMEKDVVQKVLNIKNVLNDTYTLTLRNSKHNFAEAKQKIMAQQIRELEGNLQQSNQRILEQAEQLRQNEADILQMQTQIEEVNNISNALANANQYYDTNEKAIKVTENESMVKKQAALSGILGWLEQIPELQKGQNNVRFDKRSQGSYDMASMENFAKSLNAKSHTVILNITEPILEWLGSHQHVHNFNIRHRQTVMWLVTMHILKYAGVKKTPSPSVILEDIKEMMYAANSAETTTIQSKLKKMSQEMEANLGLAGDGGSLIRSYFKDNPAMVVQADVFDISKNEKPIILAALKDLVNERSLLPKGELTKQQAQQLRQDRDRLVQRFMDKWKGTRSSSSEEADALLTQNLDILMNNPNAFGPNPEAWFEKLTYAVVQSQVLNPMEETRLKARRGLGLLGKAVKGLANLVPGK